MQNPMHPPHRPAVQRLALRTARLAAATCAGALLAACANPLPTARMALAEPLASQAAATFEGLKGEKRGQFMLDGQTVQFQRMGDALSLFDAVKMDRVAVQFDHAGHQGRCDGRGNTVTLGIVAAPVKPLELVCRFNGAQPGDLRLRERPLAAAGTRQVREGEARFGSLVLEVKSEHALQGTPLPLPQPAGYRILQQGRDVAALELTDTRPTLRRAPGLDEPTRAAVTQVALALGLLWDPANSAR